MPSEGVCSLQADLEQGSFKQEVVILSLTLNGLARAGVEVDGSHRNVLETAVKKVISSEAGSLVKPHHVALYIAENDMAVAPSATRLGPDTSNTNNNDHFFEGGFGADWGYGSFPEADMKKDSTQRDSAATEKRISFKGVEAQQWQSSVLSHRSDDDDPHTCIVHCVVSPPTAARPGDIVQALIRRCAPGGPGVPGPLHDRLLRELSAAEGLEAEDGEGISVAGIGVPEARLASLPDLNLDRRHGIPPKVFRLFEKLRVLDDARLIRGVRPSVTISSVEGEEIVWALRKVAEVCRDHSLEKIFGLTVSNLVRKDSRSCHRWCASLPPNALRGMLSDNPIKEQICSRPGLGVFEQTTQLQAYIRESKLCVALALVAGDALKRWSDELELEDRFWLAEAADQLAQVPDLQTNHARGLWDRSGCRYLVIDLTCRNSPSLDPALNQLRCCPQDVLCSRFKATWREGSSQEASFFYLIQHFAKHNDSNATYAFLSLVADAFAVQASSTELFEALRAFAEDVEVPAPARRELLISFVSTCRMERDVKRRSRRCCCFRKSSAMKNSEGELTVPILDGLECIIFEAIVRDYTTRESKLLAQGKTMEEIAGLTADLGELFEVVMLIAADDTMATWAMEKLNDDPTTADDAKRFLNVVAWRHLADTLRFATRSGRTVFYDEHHAKPMLEDGKRWYFDYMSDRVRWIDHVKTPEKRPAKELTQLLWMYFKFDTSLKADSIGSFMRRLEAGGGGTAIRLARLAPSGSVLRRSLARDIQARYDCASLEVGDFDALLRYVGFFNADFQHFLAEPTGLLEASEFYREAAVRDTVLGVPAARGALVSLLEAVAKLIGSGNDPDLKAPEVRNMEEDFDLDGVTEQLSDYWSVDRVVRDLVGACGPHLTSQRLLRHVTEAVRSGAFPLDCGFKIFDLLDCAHELGNAGSLLAFKLERKGVPMALLKYTEQAVQTFIRQTPPTRWAEVFRGLDTIIFALEYMGREDLQMAFEQFAAECRSTQNEALMELINCVRSIYRVPLAGDHPEALSASTDIAHAILQSSPQLPRRVVWRGVSFEPSDWRRILEISAAAAQSLRQRYNVPMLPHHTQMITLLMFAVRACGARLGGTGPKRLPKTMLARVGTGEGKSLIIAMIAAFCAKRGLRAHVVNDNRVLAARDFEGNRGIFDALGLRSSCERSGLTDKACHIVYCTGHDIEQVCLESLTNGRVEEYEEGLKEAILIVDEVDGLIFDKGVVTPKTFEDREFSEWVTTWFAQLDFQGEVERDWEDFRGQGECSIRIQKEVEQAWQDFPTKQEGVDYVIRGGVPYLLDPKTNLIQETGWCLWLEALKRHRLEGSYAAKYKYIKAILCRLQCFMSYACIFGLTGSLGRASEKEYLREHYEAASFNVPFFLDTCRAAPPRQPRSVSKNSNESPRTATKESQPQAEPFEVGDRVVINIENENGVVELDRVGTRGLVGSIIDLRADTEDAVIELSDGRLLTYKQSWLAHGRFQGKKPPRMLGGMDGGFLLPSRDAQENAVVEMAVKKRKEVPVLVVVKDPETVHRVATALRQRLGLAGDEVLELVHNPSNPEEFVELVRLATEPIAAPGQDETAGGAVSSTASPYPNRSREASHEKPPLANSDVWLAVEDENVQLPDATQQQTWRVTITTAEGGRGHDYRVVDPGVDERGGLLLILTWIPWSEREWVQFLGRTGRQDHAGQFAVFLNSEDELVSKSVAARCPGESLARAILRQGEAEAGDILKGKAAEIAKGRLMHRLTSRFWALHKIDKTSKRQDWEWKRLCENYVEFTSDAIQQVFCNSVIPPRELILGFCKTNRDAPTRPGLAELLCRNCNTINLFPKPSAGGEQPTVRCGNCGEAT